MQILLYYDIEILPNGFTTQPQVTPYWRPSDRSAVGASPTETGWFLERWQLSRSSLESNSVGASVSSWCFSTWWVDLFGKKHGDFPLDRWLKPLLRCCPKNAQRSPSWPIVWPHAPGKVFCWAKIRKSHVPSATQKCLRCLMRCQGSQLFWNLTSFCSCSMYSISCWEIFKKNTKQTINQTKQNKQNTEFYSQERAEKSCPVTISNCFWRRATSSLRTWLKEATGSNQWTNTF